MSVIPIDVCVSRRQAWQTLDSQRSRVACPFRQYQKRIVTAMLAILGLMKGKIVRLETNLAMPSQWPRLVPHWCIVGIDFEIREGTDYTLNYPTR